MARLWFDDYERDRWYAAVGRYVTRFNRLEVQVHALVGTLQGVATGDGRFAGTSNVQMGALLDLCERLLRTAEADGLFSKSEPEHWRGLLTDLRKVNADRNAIVHSVHDLEGAGGATVRRIVGAKNADQLFEARVQGRWPLGAIEDAYDSLTAASVAIPSLQMRVIAARNPGARWAVSDD